MTMIEGYNQFGGRSPESAPLTNVLHAMGALYSEPMIFGLAGGIGASYFVFEYKGAPPNVFLGMRHGLYGSPDFFGNACRRIGAVPVFKETTSGKAANRYLLETIEGGKPAVAWVCGKEEYSYHYVGVAGLDGDSVILDDMEPTPVRMSMEAFSKKRAGIASFKNRLMTVTLPGSKVDPRPGILEAIGATIRGMHESPIKSSASNFGLGSLEKFARLLGDGKDNKGWAKQFPPGPKLENGLRWVHRYTKGSAYRGMYADFLDEAVKITGIKLLAACAKKYRKLESEWKDFANLARIENEPKLADLSSAMYSLHAAELAAIKSLKDTIPETC